MTNLKLEWGGIERKNTKRILISEYNSLSINIKILMVFNLFFLTHTTSSTLW